MKNIIFNWDGIKRKLDNKIIALFLDFDGTLSPIVKNPNEAFISRETRQLLSNLSKNPRCKLAIVSGRSLKDIKKRVNVKGIIYVGNHGFQIEGAGIKFKSPILSGHKTTLKKIRSDLTKKVALVKGALVEDKGLSLSLHYRMVDKKEIRLMKNIFCEVTNSYLLKNNIKIENGKKLLEIRPAADWDKGEAVLWLLARQQYILKNDKILPIYIGDDVTDEDAFRVLENKGIGIFVGKANKKSHATFYLKDTEEVKEFLIRILELLNIGQNNGGTY